MMLFRYLFWRILIGVSRSALMASSAAKFAAFVDRDRLWFAVLVNRLIEITLRRGLVTLASQQEMDRLSGLVHRSIQVLPLSFDLDIRLIDTPAFSLRAFATPERFFKNWQQL